MAERRIPDWYRGRSVLVTGGSGFMGKVLIEKLLRGCPDIDKVYILIRTKNNKTGITRLAEIIIKSPAFEKIRKECPHLLNKLEAIEGDVGLPDVIVKNIDREKITKKVSVVFHMAASLRLEAPLKPATESNLVGTVNVLKLCTTLPNLEIFVHLSTAFCHSDNKTVEESIYPSPRDPHEIIQLVKTTDEETLRAMTPEILGVHPNCYTFTKRLAETVVSEYSSRIPTLIIRPSIVTPAIYEPIAGWVDSLNGPIGLMVGAGKGVIRSMLCDPRSRAETIPVDIAANAIIAMAARHSHKPTRSGETVPCRNISTGHLVSISWGEVLQRGRRLFLSHPFEWGLWYPGGDITTNPWIHAITVFFCQTIPAYLIDSLLFLFGQRRFMVRIQNRISVGMDVLQYFTMRQWNLQIDKGIIELSKNMHEDDLKIFYIDNVDMDVDKFLLKAILGARQYCLKEPLSSMRKARIQLKFLFLLDIALKTFLIYQLYLLSGSFIRMFKPSFSLPLLSDFVSLMISHQSEVQQ